MKADTYVNGSLSLGSLRSAKIPIQKTKTKNVTVYKPPCTQCSLNLLMIMRALQTGSDVPSRI